MKNILIFSDGTDNDTGGLADKPNPNLPENSALSNVYRLYVATDSNHHSNADISPEAQVSYYDAGLGSGEDASTKADITLFGQLGRSVYKGLAKATGYGITGNIEDCYRFLVHEYNPGDNIFLFGFSRGAYTVRSLGGLISLLGVRKTDNLNPGQIKKAIKESVAIYKTRDAEKRKARARKVSAHYYQVLPHAICVFDTVRALGINSGVSSIVGGLAERIAPHKFHDHSLNPNVEFAFHAVSIDENRRHFSVELWDNDPAECNALEQRWFPGVHSDIGGSYRDGTTGTGRDLGRLTLEWMLDRLQFHNTGLLVNQSVLDLKNGNSAKNYHLGEQHNERAKKRLGFIPTGRLWPKGFRQRASTAPLESQTSMPNEYGVIEPRVVARFNHKEEYRPEALRKHPDFSAKYTP